MQKLGKSWKSKLVVFSFIWALLYPAFVSAEGMKIIPKWTRMKGCVVTLEDSPNVRACYDFGEAMLLKKLDMDIALKYRKLELTEAVNVELRSAVAKLEMSIEKEQESLHLLQQRLEEKHRHLENVTDMYLTANRRDVLGGALPWVITAVVVFAAVGFVGGYYAAK